METHFVANVPFRMKRSGGFMSLSQRVTAAASLCLALSTAILAQTPVRTGGPAQL
jgi:hypothetical protein